MEGTTARITFRLDAPRDLNLRVGLGYPDHIRPGVQQLRILMGRRQLSDRPLAPGWSEQTCIVPRDTLRAGYNTITFRAPACGSPPGKKGHQDKRQLAILFGKITIEPTPEHPALPTQGCTTWMWVSHKFQGSKGYLCSSPYNTGQFSLEN